MDAILSEIDLQGIELERIDFTKNPERRTRQKIEGVPCLVYVSAGKEVGRRLGVTSKHRIETLIRPRIRPINITAANSQKQRKPKSVARVKPPSVSQPFRDVQSHLPSKRMDQVAGTLSYATRPQQLFYATPRLKVKRGGNNEYGSGTIIAQDGDDALIVTCSHLFDSSETFDYLEVRLFAQKGDFRVRGKLLIRHPKADVALISASGISGAPLVKLSPAGHPTQVGDSVFSTGCDHSRSPTTYRTSITANNRFWGHRNIEVKAMPKNGRSGGGLYTADLQLIGVCHGINPIRREGIYDSTDAVYEMVDNLPRWRQLLSRQQQLSLSTPSAQAKIASRF